MSASQWVIRMTIQHTEVICMDEKFNLASNGRHAEKDSLSRELLYIRTTTHNPAVNGPWQNGSLVDSLTDRWTLYVRLLTNPGRNEGRFNPSCFTIKQTHSQRKQFPMAVYCINVGLETNKHQVRSPWPAGVYWCERCINNISCGSPTPEIV